MKSRNFLPDVIKWSCAFFLFSAFVSTQAFSEDSKLDSGKYLKAVQKFADSVIKNGRDRYGDKHTPLFVDGLHVETLEPVIWEFNEALTWDWMNHIARPKGWDKEKIRIEQAKVPTQRWVLSNFSGQQTLLRTLDGLTALTGEKKYRQAAEDTTRYALRHLRSTNGLLHWGKVKAWDLQEDKPIGQWDDYHMPIGQAYYSLMWRVDPAATVKLMETVWGSHIADWSLLDNMRLGRLGFGRGTSKAARRLPQWDHEFDEDVKIPFLSKRFSLAYITTPLVHSGVMLSVLDKNADALKWTRRLVYRWQQGRDPKTGLCGGQFTYIKDDRAHRALGHKYPGINEANIVAWYHMSGRYHQLPLVQMQAGERLIAAGGKCAEIGSEFIKWASGDLKAYGRHSYDPGTGMFIAMMTDGTPIKWQECRYGYCAPENFAPSKPNGSVLWNYAMAYRLTRDEDHWCMLRELCILLRLGDIGRTPDAQRQFRFDTNQDQWQMIYALLELHRATKDKEMLRLSCHIADNILERQTKTGLFPLNNRQYARTGAEEPLAIMHLVAAIDGKGSLLPPAVYHAHGFFCEYHGDLKPHQRKRRDRRSTDQQVFYGN